MEVNNPFNLDQFRSDILLKRLYNKVEGGDRHKFTICYLATKLRDDIIKNINGIPVLDTEHEFTSNVKFKPFSLPTVFNLIVHYQVIICFLRGMGYNKKILELEYFRDKIKEISQNIVDLNLINRISSGHVYYNGITFGDYLIKVSRLFSNNPLIIDSLNDLKRNIKEYLSFSSVNRFVQKNNERIDLGDSLYDDLIKWFTSNRDLIDKIVSDLGTKLPATPYALRKNITDDFDRKIDIFVINGSNTVGIEVEVVKPDFIKKFISKLVFFSSFVKDLIFIFPKEEEAIINRTITKLRDSDYFIVNDALFEMRSFNKKLKKVIDDSPYFPLISREYYTLNMNLFEGLVNNAMFDRSKKIVNSCLDKTKNIFVDYNFEITQTKDVNWLITYISKFSKSADSKLKEVYSIIKSIVFG